MPTILIEWNSFAIAIAIALNALKRRSIVACSEGGLTGLLRLGARSAQASIEACDTLVAAIGISDGCAH